MKRLIVCVPGLDGSTTNWNPLLEKLRAEEEFAGADELHFNHGQRWWSTDFAVSLSERLLAMVNGKCVSQENGTKFEEICFMAHSMGALLVRRAYLLALLGDNRGRRPQPWAKRVTRIVMFAGINRGLCSSDEDDENRPFRFRRRLLRRTIVLSNELPGHRLLEDLLAGSDFVTNLRLSWIRALAHMEHPPTIVQVVGTDDSLVNQNDSLDIEQFPTGHRIDLAEADHETVLTVETDDGFDPGRYALIREAMFGRLEPTPSPIPPRNDVVFVVHGIRDSTTNWVDQAVNLLRSKLPDAAVVPATYGYFSALQFILPVARRRRTRWFKETYSYYLSRYPGANFHFIGHSNGTYLLGYSLKNLPDIRFNRVVLASSVLPRDFDWRSRIGYQVKEVWNHRSRWDVPVAILCAALRALNMTDIGTGGYEGFRNADVQECWYHPGGHGATVASQYVPLLVSAITEPRCVICEPREGEAVWFSRLSRASFLLPYLVLAVAGLLVYAMGPPLSSLIHQQLIVCRALISAVLLALICIFLDVV